MKSCMNIEAWFFVFEDLEAEPTNNANNNEVDLQRLHTLLKWKPWQLTFENADQFIETLEDLKDRRRAKEL